MDFRPHPFIGVPAGFLLYAHPVGVYNIQSMKIGLFTDVYYPSVTGVTFVIDILRANLEALGHDVYIVAPTTSIRPSVQKKDPYIIRFTAIRGIFFDAQYTSIFFPPRQVRKIGSLKLDVIVMLTPVQIGLLGAHAAKKFKIPLVSLYTTDLVSYVEHYPATALGALAMFVASLPTGQFSPRDILKVAKSVKSQSKINLSRKQKMLKEMLSVLHASCDATIAVSSKMAKSIKAFDVKPDRVFVLPTGVNKLPFSQAGAKSFRRYAGIDTKDVVVLYVGRLAKEKNLELLIKAFSIAAADQANLKLVLVGDFGYRKYLEDMAAASEAAGQIIFTGQVERNELGNIYAAADIFCFPSITDTQALVLNEAAHAGLPIIWCDKNGLNTVLQNDISGLLSPNNAKGLAAVITKLAGSTKLRRSFGQQAKKLAAQSSERHQAAKFAKLLKSL